MKRENKKLKGLAVCPNCSKKHYTNGKRVERECKCSYWISHQDYKEVAYN